MPTFEYSELDGSQEFRTAFRGSAPSTSLERASPRTRRVRAAPARTTNEERRRPPQAAHQGRLSGDRTKKASSHRPARACAGSKTRPSKNCSPSPARTRSASTRRDFKGAGQVRHEDSKPYEYRRSRSPISTCTRRSRTRSSASREAPNARSAGSSPGICTSRKKTSSFTRRNIRQAVPPCCCST